MTHIRPSACQTHKNSAFRCVLPVKVTKLSDARQKDFKTFFRFVNLLITRLILEILIPYSLYKALHLVAVLLRKLRILDALVGSLQLLLAPAVLL